MGSTSKFRTMLGNSITDRVKKKNNELPVNTNNPIENAINEQPPTTSDIISVDGGGNVDTTTTIKSTDNRLSRVYTNYQEVRQIPGKFGAESLGSKESLFYHTSIDNENDFFDIEGKDGAFPKVQSKGGRKITIDGILEDFSYKKQINNPYYIQDFLYAKWYGKIPLNHLITLRRFPHPTFDNMKFHGGRNIPPIVQAVTYFGAGTENELEELTKVSGTINYSELEAEVWDVQGDAGRGTEHTPFFDKMGKKTQNTLKHGNAFFNQSRNQTGNFAQDAIDAARLIDPNYPNTLYGDTNVIKKTHVKDRGIEAVQEFTITFEYQLRSYNNINPRIAMIDIICRMLALTYNNAKFWGGANRYLPDNQQFGFLGDQNAFYSGDYGTYIKSFIKQAGTALGRGLDTLTGLIGGILSGNLDTALKAIGGVAKGVGTYAMDLERAKTRPQVLGFHSLLSSAPIGEWHMVIGNPYRPIMSIGNLICTGWEMSMNGNLGVDDFPEFLKFTVTLKSGMPRDKGSVESILNYGEGRIYHEPLKNITQNNANNHAATVATPGVSTNTNVGSIPKNGVNYQNQNLKSTPKHDIGSAGVRVAERVAGTLF